MSNFLNQLNERAKEIRDFLNFRERRNIAMVENDPFSIGSIRNPSEKIQLLAVQQEPRSIGEIKEPTPKAQIMAVEKNSGVITLIDSPCEEAQRIAVREDPFALSLIKTSENVQIEAVKGNPTAIQYIDNPTEKVQLAAVEKNPHAILYIENPSEEVQLAAVQQDGNYIQTISNPSDKVALTAVNQSGYLIDAIDNPSEVVQLAAVKQNLDALKYIDHPSKETQRIAKERINDQFIEKKIEAIKILQGNAPERIFEDKFKEVRDLFPEKTNSLFENINESETGKMYKNIRMMSDENTAKKDIYQSAKSFSSEIKKSLAPAEFSQYSSELLKSDNLELGRVPTIKDTLSLFSQKYILPKQYESVVSQTTAPVEGSFIKENFKCNISIKDNHNILNAGTNPYSPNYKERFENLGLKNEFQEFQELCVKRDNWNDRYNYAVQSHDIPEIYDLERELPKLDQQIEDSRKSLYGKLKENANCKLEGIKESLNDNGYENISKEIQSNQASIVESLKVDNGSFQIKGVPITEGREKLVADIVINKKRGNVKIGMRNLSIYNTNATDKMTDANGLLTAMSSQGIKNPLDIHRAHLQDLIMGSAVNVKTASGMKAMHLAQSPAGLTLKVVSGIFQQLDACASN